MNDKNSQEGRESKPKDHFESPFTRIEPATAIADVDHELLERHLLEAEYEQEAVPEHARRSLGSVSLVWLGFPMIITGAITGALIVAGLGFQRGLLAIALGNLALFLYVGGLSALGAKSGYNFALLARTTFGARGYVMASGLLSTIVVGWFTVQTGLTAVSLNAAFGWNLLAMTVIAGLLYLGITLVGIKALSWVGALSAPLFLAFGVYAVIVALNDSSLNTIVQYDGKGGASTLTLGAAVAIVVALFIDGGTMTPDFTRWAKSTSHAWIATFAAFPFANGVAMIFGGIVAASAASNPDFFGLVADKGGIVSVLAVVFLFLNLGSVCSHCLYNASVGWAHILGKSFRIVAVVLGIIGTIIAATGAWDQFVNWLTILGIIVPPVGAVILADHLLHGKRREGRDAFDLATIPDFRATPLIAWAIGAAVALWSNYQAPQLSVVVVGFVVTVVAYEILERLIPESQAELS